MQKIPFHLPQQITQKTAWISTSGLSLSCWQTIPLLSLLLEQTWLLLLVCEVRGAKDKVDTVTSICRAISFEPIQQSPVVYTPQQ